MSNLVDLNIGNRIIKVSNLKKEYIENIIKSASLCKYITKIILFGSSLEEQCTEYSDIDIAVFGTKTLPQIMRLKSYSKKFYDSIYSFALHPYDILYFQEGKYDNSGLMNNILKGEVIYQNNEDYTSEQYIRKE